MAPAGSPNAAAAPFELTAFLDGKTSAWGIFEDRFGRLRQTFSIEMNGRWIDGVFQLDERFAYDDGRVDLRTWRVRRFSPERFEASCDDCVGVASGICAPGVVRMTYAFRLRLRTRTLTVDCQDRLYKISDTSAVNRIAISKWGLKIGELSLFVQKSAENVAGAKPERLSHVTAA
jgi:hypothetical protein